MKVCVLQPDYSTSKVDYKNYDPPRTLSPLLQGHEVDHIFLNKLTTYEQLKDLRKRNYDIYINLCEGYLEWDIPSIDVIYSLELLKLPFTGPTGDLYDPPKELMKYVAFTCGVAAAPFRVVKNGDAIENIQEELSFPLFVKPAKAGDSLGIDRDSLVNNFEELSNKTNSLLSQFDEVIVEEYISGREFTVLVARHPGDQNRCEVYDPIEFVFPNGYSFKTYELKTSALHAEANIPCKDAQLSKNLKAAAEKIFNAFEGKGYARLDFRMAPNGKIFFLEINFTCSVFYENGYEGSADHILLNAEGGKERFLKLIISEGIYRHRIKQPKYFVQQNALEGYGIYAARDIAAGEIVFRGEESPHRLVTRSFVFQNWNKEETKNFYRYAWPISDEVYILWNTNPSDWAPQNHSCNPNTKYKGLNLIANRLITKGEELTLDYTDFLNAEMDSFICICGAQNCKKVIQGKKENSITYFEKNPHRPSEAAN